MNKYIRTKDDIISTENLVNLETEDSRFKDKNIYRNKNGVLYEALNQADTPEELCDCFVVVGKKHYIWDKQHCLGLTFEQVKQSYSAYDFEIYGAIWTKWSLKYVVKMNEEGSLIRYEY